MTDPVTPRRMPSVDDCLIDHRRRRVERYWRDRAGHWWRDELIGDGTMPIPCPEPARSLGEIDQGVQLRAVSEPEPA